MKTTLATLSFIISIAALANMNERGPRPEPTAEEKACFDEIRSLNCGSPREDREAFQTCIDSKASTLSSTCQAFHEKMKNRPSRQRPDQGSGSSAIAQ